MKKLLRLRNFLLIIVLILTSAPAYSWWLWVEGFPVQEETKLDKLAADVHEVTEQLEILKNHLAMLNSLKSKLLQLGTGQIMQIFTEAQSFLQNAKSLTSDISNFGEAFKQHFPDDYEGIISAISEGKRLNNDWRKVEEGYMKVLNMTAKNFDNEQNIRDNMMQTLNRSEEHTSELQSR